VEKVGVHINGKNKIGKTALTKSIDNVLSLCSSSPSSEYVDEGYMEIIQYLIDIGIQFTHDFFLFRKRVSYIIKAGSETCKRIKKMEEKVMDGFQGAIQNEIFETLFSSGSPFSGVEGGKGTFGYYVIQTILHYAVPDVDTLSDLSLIDSEWDPFLRQINSFQDRKRSYIFQQTKGEGSQ
jgi:hypothetical protein